MRWEKNDKECVIKFVPNDEERETYSMRELEALIRLNLSDKSTRNIIKHFNSKFVQFNKMDLHLIGELHHA